ncbi:MAG TPA: LytTR family transcriptional regulator DNA-binding domain-containing protein [Bacteroidales bacterium]|jgi:two-component system LytT family response regulator|nr:LytTR family transcriptional regulator DNA-binding domain-containing protein [Bacteroidales bacterium]HOS71539.1 LytTR family transcriptional regulator DNA-binding domain-containing protein [Bacteroidales bacterium]HQH23123.1 LytTR family transcriptional regulator DNA-binding domain-containing protein [Bacteroidales bacterium]HQJ81019.1 LytTR family transcriptional regulator DNA-binding domain-containing protein [Bacteroidales bacterium]
MKKIRTIIIDDESPARELIRHYLQDLDYIDIISECSDGFSGLKAITAMKPGLVFLDIQMPRLTGIEMLEVMTEKPEIIFTTAYDQYAIRAFELNAVDYLLKPFDKRRFLDAVNRAAEKIRSGTAGREAANRILSQLPAPEAPVARIVVRTGNAIRIIPVEKIRYLEAQDDYVMVHHIEGRALKQQTMKYYEDNLPPADFIRIHRSYMVRVQEISKIEPYGKDSHIAVLKSGDRLPVSRTGYQNLKKELDF